jgi:hypothetical protein
MDIYSFIRSPDVAAHCRKIGKTWNTCETAVIISRSDRPTADKHAAWRELIDCYPDMPAMPNFHRVDFESTHKMLAETMDYERRILERFKTPESGAIYRYGVEWTGKTDDSSFFTSFEKADADLKDQWTRDEAPRICFEKVIMGGAGESAGRISCNFDYEGNLYGLCVSVTDEAHANLLPGTDRGNLWGDNLATLFFIDIPSPFKRGDLLTYNGNGETDVFVLDSINRDDPERLARYLRGEAADGTDLTGWGFFVDDVGALYGDHAYDYDRFEYYTGRLEGKNRLLHYVGLYMTGEIGLPELLNMQCRIVAEQLLSNRFNINSHGCCIPESLLAENRPAH